jgi:hypothetical protein
MKEDMLLEQIYMEGLWNQMKAKGSALGSTMLQKGAQGVGKVAGALGSTRAQAGANEFAANAQLDAEEKKAASLMKGVTAKLTKLNAELAKDAQAVGIDLNKLAQADYTKSGKYPKLAGISEFMRAINKALTIR